MASCRTPAGPPPFDALTEDALRAGRQPQVDPVRPTRIGAFVAEMDFGTAPAVTRSLHETVERGRLGYLTPEAAADMARACAGWLAAPLRLGGAAGVDHAAGRRRRRAAGGHRALHAPGHPGRPPHAGLHAVPDGPGRAGPGADRGADGRAGRPDDLRPRRHRRRRSTRGARLLVHVNPHNPLGRVFDAEEQLALADVVDGRRRAGLLRRDPRAARPPGRRAPPVRLAVPGDRRGTPSRRRRRPRPGTCPASRPRS